MEDEIILHCILEKKGRVLSHPDFYTDTPMLMLRIRKEYLPKLIEFSENHNINNLEITLKEWPKDITERAWNYFFALRDKVCEAQGDMSKENKDNIYRSCIRDLDFRLAGRKKDSIKELSQRELWLASEHMLEYCYEAEADMRGLVEEFREFQTENKE